jgi:hypothetical protein
MLQGLAKYAEMVFEIIIKVENDVVIHDTKTT